MRTLYMQNSPVESVTLTYQLSALLRPLNNFFSMIVTNMVKFPIFVDEITSFLKQELERESSIPQRDAAPVSPSRGTRLMLGQ